MTIAGALKADPVQAPMTPCDIHPEDNSGARAAIEIVSSLGLGIGAALFKKALSSVLDDILRTPTSNRALKLPSIDPNLANTTMLGYTTPDGRVFLRPGLSRADQISTLRHESVHAFLSVRGNSPLAKLRQNIGILGYDKSQLLRFTEEAVAETYGSKSLIQGLKHPLDNDYGITIGGLATESIFVGGTFTSAAYFSFQFASNDE